MSGKNFTDVKPSRKDRVATTIPLENDVLSN